MEFKNFGEALAWMMESPENVAVCDAGVPYKWEDEHLQYKDKRAQKWTVNAYELTELNDRGWSRAPHEPLELRGTGRSSSNGWLNYVVVCGQPVNDIRLDMMRDLPEGTKFELILKEKN